MKASLKFREEQKKPLLRFKIPLTIFNTPFQSGIVAGDSKELTLNLSTFFQSGPSLKLSYRPNDSSNPFSLIIKTGTGLFGSPISSSMLMSCEFNLKNINGSCCGPHNPLFMLHFKPNFGDFTFKKSQSSILDSKGLGFQKGGFLGKDDVSGQSPVINAFSDGKVSSLGAISSLFSGTEVAARTSFPIRDRVAVNFRWGVRVPAGMKGETAFLKAPFLVMDKIGVEHLPEFGDSKKGNAVAPASGDVVETFFDVKRQMEVLQVENGLLWNAVEELRRDFERNGGKGKSFEGRKNEKKRGSDFNGYPGKSTKTVASEELKKTFVGATAVGV